MSAAIPIGVDVGGTFTDIVAPTATGELVALKTPSDPSDPAGAVLRGLGQLAEALELGLGEMLGRASIVHGTTMGLNTLLTRSGSRTGLICTDGFRDILEMRTGHKENRYDLAQAPPEPLVPRSLRLPVRERVAATGEVLAPLREEDVREACRTFAAEGVEAVAICFIWSFMEPAHELRAAEICRELLPEAYITTSWDVLPEIREYDRVSTTVLNAYIGPLVGAYVEDLENQLSLAGHEGVVHYLQSNGGMASGAEVTRVPVRTLFSGPSAGPAVGRMFSVASGSENTIVVDMGGTSFDASVVTAGEIRRTRPVDLDGVRIGLPMVDIRSVDGGGGSIAREDAGILRVGPRSAGAVPGPASYGFGGTEPTVTDANLLLGVYGAGQLAAEVSLDDEAARTVIGQLGDSLGVSSPEAAVGVWQVLAVGLAQTVREITVAEGVDPRRYTLVSGGGAGPAHCCAIAEELELREILVPRPAATLCAFGALIGDIVYEARRSLPVLLDENADIGAVATAIGEMEEQVLGHIREGGGDADEPRIERHLELRYPDQIWEIPVRLEAGEITAEMIDEACDEFHQRHYDLYGFADQNEVCELVGLGVRAVAERDLPEFSWPASPASEWQLLGSRLIAAGVAGDAAVDVPVYDGSAAPLDTRIYGPAVVADSNTSIFVGRGWSCELRDYGAFQLLREEERG
jgi:N-methylhydantoinase A